MAQNSKSHGNPAPNKYRLTGFVLTIAALAGFLALVLFFFVGTSVEGEEFSPATFQLRKFSYRRIPGVRLRITKTVYDPAVSLVGTEVLKHLPGSIANPRWDVVTVNEGASSDERRASILVRSLKIDGPNRSSYWEEWSHYHPSIANVLWPIVQEAALQEKYSCIPELLQAASDASSAAQLSTTCKKIIEESLAVPSE